MISHSDYVKRASSISETDEEMKSSVEEVNFSGDPSGGSMDCFDHSMYLPSDPACKSCLLKEKCRSNSEL